MKKEYFIVHAYQLKIEVRVIDSTKVHKDEKGLYFAEYCYGQYLEDDNTREVRLYETQEEAKKYLISQTERNVENIKSQLEEWERKLKELKDA